MFIFTKWIAVFVSSAALICAAHAQDYAGRKELKRSDLTGTNMEVVVNISETKPGPSPSSTYSSRGRGVLRA